MVGPREKKMIEKENNFQQAGDNYRSFDPARRERFIKRLSDALNAPRVSPETKAIWLNIWTECDVDLGRRLASQVKMNKM